jgi:hypothetical protein
VSSRFRPTNLRDEWLDSSYGRRDEMGWTATKSTVKEKLERRPKSLTVINFNALRDRACNFCVPCAVIIRDLEAKNSNPVGGKKETKIFLTRNPFFPRQQPLSAFPLPSSREEILRRPLLSSSSLFFCTKKGSIRWHSDEIYSNFHDLFSFLLLLDLFNSKDRKKQLWCVFRLELLICRV